MAEPIITPHEFYDGSTIFQPLSDISGLSIDKMNFLVCQLMAVLLGFPFRLLLGPHLVGPTVRHIVEITVGLLIAYFCFGSQTLHLVLQSCMSLVIMRMVPSELIGPMVLILAMGYLYICHLLRMAYDYGGNTLDITGPLMISTQRLTSLAFGLKDGLWGCRSEYTEMMRKHAIQRQPSLLEFFSYIFCFHGVLCGPFCFYKDYIAFIDGTSYMPWLEGTSMSNEDFGQPIGPQLSPPPAPGEHLTMKLLTAAVFGLSSILVLPFFPITFLTGLEFKVHGFAMKILITILWPLIQRHKYYYYWKLGEAANVSCGLGFNGYRHTGCAKWNLIDNVNIMQAELATSPKMFLDNWNISTMKWLRYVVYDRWHSMAVVLLFSASWHGFYGGYYLAAFTMLLLLLAAQKIRSCMRPCRVSYCGCSIGGTPFQSPSDVLAFLATSLCVPYAACAFLILSFEPAFVFYSQVYFWIQTLCIAAILLL